MTRIVFIFSALILLASCRSTRNISTAITKKDSTVVKAAVNEAPIDTLTAIRGLLAEIKKNSIDYRTFTANKVNVDYRGADGKNYNVNAAVRMYRDSAIWISANAVLGIEALRVYITRDSVKYLDKINKTYTARSLSYLQTLTELPLDLSTLQDLIVGNPVFVDSAVSHFTGGAGVLNLITIGPIFKNLLTVNESDKVVLRSKLDDNDVTHSRTAELTYADFDSNNSLKSTFAKKRRILVSERKALDVRMDFRQYDFNNDVSFPFSIPKNYKKD